MAGEASILAISRRRRSRRGAVGLRPSRADRRCL